MKTMNLTFSGQPLGSTWETATYDKSQTPPNNTIRRMFPCTP
jgi:hypothetical protein